MSKKQIAPKCPLCSIESVSSDVLSTVEHLAQQGVITLYRSLQAKAESEVRTDNPLPCPRCGNSRMSSKISRNALSRHADIQICDICGIDEAARVFSGSVLPISSWWAVREALSNTNQ